MFSCGTRKSPPRLVQESRRQGWALILCKALVVDEIAVKVKRTAQPTLQEAASFHRVDLLAAMCLAL